MDVASKGPKDVMLNVELIINKYFGRTKHMTPVIVEGDECKPGELIDIKITSFNQNNLFGFYKANKERAA